MAPEATLIEVPSYNKGVAMLIAGQADAMVADMTQCVLSDAALPRRRPNDLEQAIDRRAYWHCGQQR